MNLKALKDRPAVSALPQRVRMDSDRELSLFGHDANMGRRAKERQRKIRLPQLAGPLPKISEAIAAAGSRVKVGD